MFPQRTVFFDRIFCMSSHRSPPISPTRIPVSSMNLYISSYQLFVRSRYSRKISCSSTESTLRLTFSQMEQKKRDFDIFEGNHSLYHVDRVIRETGKVVDNGFEEVYVNAKVTDGSEVSELMEVFVDDTAYNSKFPVTSGSKRRYKTTEEGQQVMCEIVERLVNENIERMNALTSILIELDRIDDLKRATKDKEFQMQLMIELLPEDM